MIQGDLQHIIGSETIGSFCGYLGLVVETLDTAQGNLSFGPEPVQQQPPVSTEHFGHLLHRFEPGAHGPCAPFVEEFASPYRRAIRPETMEIFFEQISPDGLEIAGEQITQPVHLVIGEVLRPFQKTPAAAGQDGFLALGLEDLGLLSPDLINGLVHVAHHMEPVEDVYRSGRLLRYDPQVGLPHVAAYKPQHLTSLWSEPVEEAPERLGGPVAAYPEQPSSPGIELIDQGDELILALAPADLVGADGHDSFQITIRKTPYHRHLDRSEDILPSGLKGLGNLQPGKALSPTGQEPRISGGQVPFPLYPGDSLDLDPASSAVDSPHGIEEKYRYPPQGHELKPALAHGVVARPGLAATGADWPTTLSGFDFYLQGQSPRLLTPTNLAVHKTSMQLNPIQDRLDLHPVFSSLVMDFLVDLHNAK